MEIKLNPNGDIARDNNGINVTSTIDTIVSHIDHVLRSKPGDWAEYPELGAYIQQYVGYPNIPSTKDLIEEEVGEELKRDPVLKPFQMSVIFTPTSKNNALLETIVELPEGSEIRIEKDLDMATGIFTKEGLSFTPVIYNETNLKTKTELIEIEDETNVFELQQIPVNDNLLLTEYDTTTSLVTNDGKISAPEKEVTESYNFIDIPSGQDLPSGAVSAREFNHTNEVSSVLENKQVSSIEVYADFEEYTINDDYDINSERLKFKDYKTTYVDGEEVSYGLKEDPSGFVDVTVKYHDTIPVMSINTVTNDSIPKNAYPRTRTPEKTYVSTKQDLDPGVYIVQYLTYKLEV